VGKVEKVRQVIGNAPMAETAVKYVISHPDGLIAIPGATSEEQARNNARAGADLLPADTYDALKALP
jgi:aryl-alcohol dehydrogenase-like predicted oxidoreductase